MSVSADTLRALMAAGVNGEALLAVVESIDRDMAQTLALNGIPVDFTAEKRRAYDRERKAKKAAAKRSTEIPPDNSTGIPPEAAGNSSSIKVTLPSSVETQKEESMEEKKEPKADKPTRNSTGSVGTRLPADWKPSADEIRFAMSEGYSEHAAWREAATYRDYWVAQPGAKGRKTDWPATWRNWIRRNSRNDRNSGNQAQSGGLTAAIDRLDARINGRANHGAERFDDELPFDAGGGLPGFAGGYR